MIIERLESPEEFLKLRNEWDELLHSAASDCVFLTHEWLYTWWKHLAGNRTLSILTVRSNGRLEGIAPLTLRPPQYSRWTPCALEFVGSGVIGSDYLDLIVRQGSEEGVLLLIARYLNDARLLLQLNQLRRGVGMAADMVRHLEAKHWRVTEAKLNICPYIDLSSHTLESYLATLSSNQRYNFQRRLRNLRNNSSFQMRCASSADEADQMLDTLIQLHCRRWESRTDASEAFQTPDIVAFHKEFVQLALKRGWLRLLSLWLDGRPVAALYGLRYGAGFSFYQSGFDPAYSKLSVGLVMMGLAIQSAIDEGALEYDFLHGDEEYKFHWASETRDIGRIECYPPHSKGLIYRRAIHLNRAARQMARRVLARS
jgi:CelD/BcsL family acetyltransferase involved in cellulose biosynthesis